MDGESNHRILLRYDVFQLFAKVIVMGVKRFSASKLLRAAMWTLLATVASIVAALSAVVWTLKPERLTPMLERMASEHLDADVTIGRAEITLWHNFPRLRVELQEVDIVSRAFDGITPAERALLPADADSLMQFGYFTGSIDLMKVLGGKIALSNVYIDRPEINMVTLNDSVANFNIFPEEVKHARMEHLPEITLSHFAITNARGITYRTFPDSTSIALDMRLMEVDEGDMPLYNLSLNTNLKTPWFDNLNMRNVAVQLDGSVKWSASNPYSISLREFAILLDDIGVKINTDIDFHDVITLDNTRVVTDPVSISSLIRHLPPALRSRFDDLQTNMRATLAARLTTPVRFSGSKMKMPSGNISVDVPDCYIHYRDIDCDTFGIKCTLDFDGANPDRSVINLSRLVVVSPGIDLDMRGEVTHPLSDPLITGAVKGSIDFNALPTAVRDIVGTPTVKGAVDVDTQIDRLLLSDVGSGNLRNIDIEGNVDLRRFSYLSPDSLTELRTHRAHIAFGNEAAAPTDSLLRMSLDVDTLNFRYDYDNRGSLRGLSATLGGRGSALPDSTPTALLPFGGNVSIDEFDYLSSVDSIDIRFHDVKGNTVLQPRGDNALRPLLTASLDVGNTLIDHPDVTTSLQGVRFRLAADLKLPQLDGSTKSLFAFASNHAKTQRKNERSRVARHEARYSDAAVVAQHLDRSLRALLMRSNLRGTIQANCGRLSFQHSPMPALFRDIDLQFTTDSLTIRSLNARFGRSDVALSGTAAGFFRHPASSRRPSKLTFNLNVESDTLNVNEIAHIFTHATDTLYTESDADRALRIWTEQQKPYYALHRVTRHAEWPTPLLVPTDIDASLKLNVANICYSDLIIKRLNGTMTMRDGRFDISRLTADTDAGDITLSGSYTAPTPNDISLDASLDVSNFSLDKIPVTLPGVGEVPEMLRSLDGLIDITANAQTRLSPSMDVDMQSLQADMRVKADHIVIADTDIKQRLARWLVFHDKRQLAVGDIDLHAKLSNGVVTVEPFMVTLDHYRFGVMGNYELNGPLSMHISVLRSPVPWKFGINITGTPAHLKLRFGGAKLHPNKSNTALTLSPNK